MLHICSHALRKRPVCLKTFTSGPVRDILNKLRIRNAHIRHICYRKLCSFTFRKIRNKNSKKKNKITTHKCLSLFYMPNKTRQHIQYRHCIGRVKIIVKFHTAALTCHPLESRDMKDMLAVYALLLKMTS